MQEDRPPLQPGRIVGSVGHGGVTPVQAQVEAVIQPQPAAQMHLTRVEQLLNVSVPLEQIPDHLRSIVPAHRNRNGDER